MKDQTKAATGKIVKQNELFLMRNLQLLVELYQLLPQDSKQASKARDFAKGDDLMTLNDALN